MVLQGNKLESDKLVMEEKKRRKTRPREQKETFSIYLSTSDKLALQEIADSRDMSVSAVIRQAVDQFIKESGIGTKMSA